MLYSFSSSKEELKTPLIGFQSGMNFRDFKEQNSGLGRVINKRDTLKIIVEFSDCGEWGGHKESILLHRNSENKINATLIIDSVSCQNIRTLFAYPEKTKDTCAYSDIDDKSRVVILDTTKALTGNDEKLLNLFLHRIFELYLNQNSFSTSDSVETFCIYKGSGASIRVENTDLSLKLFYLNIDESANTWYGKVKKEIFGKD